MALTKIEEGFFSTLDLMCRLKLGLEDNAKATDEGSRFIFDVLDILVNIMKGDEQCFYKLCEYYKSVNADLPEQAHVTTEEALTTKHICERFFYQ
jgi:hypothetical protein